MSENENKTGHGGARTGAGRKPVRDEEKQNALFVEAVKTITGEDDDDEAKKALIVKLWNSGGRGQMFVAEHVFGKAPDVVQVTKKNEFPDLSNFSVTDLENLLKDD